MSTFPNRVILLGGSSGGVKAAGEVLSGLESDFPAAVIIVLHLHDGTSPSLRSTFASASPLPVDLAAEGDSISSGRIYIAPPDHHLLVRNGSIHLNRGPRVNMTRPAIDLAFRSAAVACGSNTVGIVLSGMLDDGVAGLEAVRRCGGIGVVQDPADALYPELPENVLSYTDVDHILPASRMGELLNKLAKTSGKKKKAIPPELKLENELDMKFTQELPSLDRVGGQVPLVCPECKGPLWEIRKSVPPRFRCHIGHGFTLRTLRKSQDEQLEKILLTTFRSLEEKAQTQERMAESHQQNGQERMAQSCRRRASATRLQADRLHSMLAGGRL